MKLPDKFEIHKYGLHARLVNEDDAEFIVNLRKDERAKFMNTVSPDIENQKEWIEKYKYREQNGLDYYFIYSLGGKPLGVNRIYSIKKDSFIGGSFIFKHDCEFEIPILATLIQYYIGFELLDKSICFGNIHIDNKKAIKFNKLMGNDFIYNYENEVFIVLSKKRYIEIKKKYEELLLV